MMVKCKHLPNIRLIDHSMRLLFSEKGGEDASSETRYWKWNQCSAYADDVDIA